MYAHVASKTPSKSEAMITVTITTRVAALVSLRVGHETLLNSVTHSEASPKISSLRHAEYTPTPARTKRRRVDDELLGFGEIAPHPLTGLDQQEHERQTGCRKQDMDPLSFHRFRLAPLGRSSRFPPITPGPSPSSRCWFPQSLAGQEGFEPPTRGFGDRRSTSSSY
jgi:hypothetical protein